MAMPPSLRNTAGSEASLNEGGAQQRGAALSRAALARPWLSALLLGALSATGFAPLSLWPVALICIALLFPLMKRAGGPAGAFAIGYAFGFGQSVIALNWIARAFIFQDSMPTWLGAIAVPLLSLYLALFPAAAVAIAWRLARARPDALVVVLAGAWTLTEYLRGTMFTGFPWNPMGVIWLDTGVEHAATVIGSYGLGAIAILAGGALWMAIGGPRRGAMVILLPVIATAIFGRAAPDTPSAGPWIKVVQPNIGQGDKDAPGFEARNFRRLASLTGTADGRDYLIFWPEGAIPAILDMEPEWRLRLASLLGKGDLLMTGGDKFHFRPTEAAYYQPGDLLGANNSTWVLTPDARLAGRYDKAHLVPYGEYLPMRPVLSAIGLSRLVAGDVDYWPGPGPASLPLPGHGDRPSLMMGVQICYEIVFPGQTVDRGNRPDFLFNPSNDAWFGHWGPPQHLAQARLRAVEEGLPVIRSTPTGISAVVDADGRIVAQLPLGQAGVIVTRMPAAQPPTLFAHAGNSLPLLLAGMLLLGGVAITRPRR